MSRLCEVCTLYKPNVAGGVCFDCDQGAPPPATGFEAVAAANTGKLNQPALITMSDVEPEAVEFLWSPYLPLGKLTLLEGDPEAGKTWISLAIATAISLGARLPDATEATERGNVVLMTCEDGLADTIRPRLDTFGADVSRVHALTGKRDEKGRVRPLSLEDIGVICEAVKRTRATLVVVDPIQGYLGSGVDMHRANEVRPLLAGLSRMAEDYRCAVLGIRHLTKGSANRALYRGMGSIDFTAAARSVLLAGSDGKDDQARAVVHLKSSCAAKGESQGYALLPDPGGLVWTGRSDLKAADLVAPESDGGDRDALGEAVAFLRDELAVAPKPATEVMKAARKAGHSQRTIERAKPKAGVRSAKLANQWVWQLIP